MSNDMKWKKINLKKFFILKKFPNIVKIIRSAIFIKVDRILRNLQSFFIIFFL